MTPIINYAHRGASGYCPENTMIAFKKGLELGATGIETDVQRTKDGKLVLIHDESVERTTGQQGEIKDLTYDEISRLDAGSWFDSAFAGERIPLLDELLDWAAPTELILNLELKNNMEAYTGMEEQVIAAIQQRGLSARTIISSFNHYSLATCKQLAPDIRTGILYGDNLYHPWAYAQSVGAEALHPYHLFLTEEIVQQAAAHGVISNPFTINEPERMRELIQMGVAGIITDYPDRLAELLSSTVS
ncbi:glycerophosphodiester phosphodiesterase [Paenibacillus sp. WLX1005]|uniref:glycerophosphodiester phosphodiesterase n=1 Tax=Paenibacillus sp. WLX1005 TaxID=3243766 RepID=UPI003983EF7E